MVHPDVVIFMGNDSNPQKTPTTQPFSFIFVAMIFRFIMNFTPLKYSRLVQWVSWYEQFVVKIGLHATAK